MPSASEVMVQPQEHGDPDLFVVLVDLDVVKSVDDPVDELDSERLIVGLDVDPVPANQAWVSARRVLDDWVPAERPTIPKADEHPQLDDMGAKAGVPDPDGRTGDLVAAPRRRGAA